MFKNNLQRIWTYADGSWNLCQYLGGRAPVYVAPPPTNCREDILNRSGLGGDGGYNWNTFNFINSGKMYVSEAWADYYFPSVIGSSPASTTIGDAWDTYGFTENRAGKDYYGLGKNNKLLTFGPESPPKPNRIVRGGVAMFKDGKVYSSGVEMYYPWIEANVDNIKDIHVPMHEGEAGAGHALCILLKTGELLTLNFTPDGSAENSIPSVIEGVYIKPNGTSPDVNADWTAAEAPNRKRLTDVNRILAINRGHSADMLVACDDDTVWQVKFPVSRSDYTNGWNENSVGGGAWAYQLKGFNDRPLLASELCFITIGDPGDSVQFVLNGKPQELYRLRVDLTGTTEKYRALNSFQWFTGGAIQINLTPYTDSLGDDIGNLLESDEFFVDGGANEFYTALLTNKAVHTFKSIYSTWAVGDPYNKLSLPAGADAVTFPTATAYAFIVELSNGYYLVSRQGLASFDIMSSDNNNLNGAYSNAPDKLEFLTDYSALATSLGHSFEAVCAPCFTSVEPQNTPDIVAHEFITSIVEDPAQVYTYTSETGKQTTWTTAAGLSDAVIDEYTDINFWLDGSDSIAKATTETGSTISHTNPEIINMINNFLKPMLFPFYGGDSSLPSTDPINVTAEIAYTERVNIITSINERFLEDIVNQPLNPGASGVINIVFQDEANSTYHADFTGSASLDPESTPTTDYITDIAAYRSLVDSWPDGFYKTAIISFFEQGNDDGTAEPTGEPSYVEGGTNENRRQFNNLIHAMSYGIGAYAGVNGVSDYRNNKTWVHSSKVRIDRSSAYYFKIVFDAISKFR